jgi:hypothetical protein
MVLPPLPTLSRSVMWCYRLSGTGNDKNGVGSRHVYREFLGRTEKQIISPSFESYEVRTIVCTKSYICIGNVSISVWSHNTISGRVLNKILTLCCVYITKDIFLTSFHLSTYGTSYLSLCVCLSLKEVATLSLRSQWLSNQFVLSNGNPVAPFERPWKIPLYEQRRRRGGGGGALVVYFDKLLSITKSHDRRVIFILAASESIRHYSTLLIRPVKTNVRK